MKRRAVRGSLALTAPLLVAALLAPSDAPIIIRHDRDDASYLELGQRYAGALVDMNLEAAGAPPDGHGVLVGPRWVLTAAHVAAEVEPGHELTAGGGEHAAEAVFVHPEWGGGATNDIALIALATPARGATSAGLYAEDDEVGRTVVVVGRGDFGTGVTGPTGNDRRLRGATNRVDGANEALIWWRFDAPGDSAVTEVEGISGPGDSGGPALLDLDGKIHVVGVSSAQSTSATGGQEGVYGVTEYYARVSSHLAWIERTMSEPIR